MAGIHDALRLGGGREGDYIPELGRVGPRQFGLALITPEGTIGAGELLIVLGRPGSGCSTFLKTICGETHGLNVNDGSVIHYDGASHPSSRKVTANRQQEYLKMI